MTIYSICFRSEALDEEIPCRYIRWIDRYSVEVRLMRSYVGIPQGSVIVVPCWTIEGEIPENPFLRLEVSTEELAA